MGAQLARDVPFSAICWSSLEPVRFLSSRCPTIVESFGPFMSLCDKIFLSHISRQGENSSELWVMKQMLHVSLRQTSQQAFLQEVLLLLPHARLMLLKHEGR